VTPSLADQAARDRIRTDLDTTLVVEAAAGTGKTTALVARMVAAIAAARALLDRLVAVTFTEAAAGELKLRLRTALERARQAPDCAPDVAERLRAALPQLEAARIGTIHAFCAELLRERPIEAGVDPLFQVAPDDVSGVLFARAFGRWFEAQLDHPGPGVRRILRRRTRSAGPRSLLEGAARELVEWRDLAAPWSRVAFDRDREIDELLAGLAALGPEPMPSGERDFLGRSLHEIASFVDHVARREQLRGRDYDGLEAELGELCRARHWRWRGWLRANEAARKDRRDRRDDLKARLDAFVQNAGADLAPMLRDELAARKKLLKPKPVATAPPVVVVAAPKPAEPKPATASKPAARKSPAPKPAAAKTAAPKPATAKSAPKSAPKPAATRPAPKATGTS
jgi:hypothetical protein